MSNTLFTLFYLVPPNISSTFVYLRIIMYYLPLMIFHTSVQSSLSWVMTLSDTCQFQYVVHVGYLCCSISTSSVRWIDIFCSSLNPGLVYQEYWFSAAVQVYVGWASIFFFFLASSVRFLISSIVIEWRPKKLRKGPYPGSYKSLSRILDSGFDYPWE